MKSVKEQSVTTVILHLALSVRHLINQNAKKVNNIIVN